MELAQYLIYLFVEHFRLWPLIFTTIPTSFQNAELKPLIFLEDVYITGICASNCSSQLMKIDSSGFKSRSCMLIMNEFDPAKDVTILNDCGEEDEKFLFWYQLILEQRQRVKSLALLAPSNTGTICSSSRV